MKVVVGENIEIYNPASVDLDTEIVEVNASLFRSMTPEERRLVILHEAGHCYYNTVGDESLADRFSLEVLAGSESSSLRKNLERLIGVLSSAGVSEQRLRALVLNALEIDYEKFGNEEAGKLLEEAKSRKANCGGLAASIIAAIIVAATTVMTTCVSMGVQKRANWFVGDPKGTTKNGYKIDLIQIATRHYVAELLKYNYMKGEEYIYSVLNNKSKTYSMVHAKLRGYFFDVNIFTRSFGNETNFYKSKNCGWAKAEIDKEVEAQKDWVHAKLVEAGYIEEKKAPSNINWSGIAIIAVAAIVGILILKKK